MTDTGTREPAGSTEGSGEGHGHPGVKEYVEIGIILAVLTAIEVGLFFAPVPRAVAVPSLLALTAAKFVLVVLWFMHLRFDSQWFRRLFWTALIGASLLFLVTVSITVL